MDISHCAQGYYDQGYYENRAVADVVDFLKSVCKEYLQNVFITSIFSDEINGS